MRKDAQEELKESFSFKLFPKEILQHLFSYLPLSQLATLQRVEKIDKQKPQDNAKFWNDAKLFALQSQFPNYLHQIETLLKQGFNANQTGQTIRYFGKNANDPQAKLFLKLTQVNNDGLPQINEEDFSLLGEFILNLPQHSILNYLLEKQQQKQLDFLFNLYNNLLYTSIMSYNGETPRSHPELMKLPSKLHAYLIYTVLANNWELFKINLSAERPVILQLLTFAFEHKNTTLLFSIIPMLYSFSQFNQIKILEDCLELIKHNEDFLSSIIPSETFEYSDSDEPEIVLDLQENENCLSYIISLLLNDATQHQLEPSINTIIKFADQHNIKTNAKQFYFNYLAFLIVYGHAERLKQVLEDCKKQNINFREFKLAIYTAFTKRNFTKIVSTLENNGISFETARLYKIENSEHIKLLNDRGDDLTLLLSIKQPLLYFAIIAENLNLIDKLVNQDPLALDRNHTVLMAGIQEMLGARFHYALEIALKLKAYSVINYLIRLGAKTDNLALYQILLLTDFKKLIERLNVIECYSEIENDLINKFYAAFEDIAEGSRTILHEAVALDYRETPVDFKCQKICFLLLTKGADPHLYSVNYGEIDGRYIETRESAIDTLANNPNINPDEKEFIQFMFHNYTTLFTNDSLKIKLLKTTKNSLTELKQPPENDGKQHNLRIDNFFIYFSKELENINDMDANAIMEKMQNIIHYYQEQPINKILQFLVNFISLHQTLMPLLHNESQSTLKPI